MQHRPTYFIAAILLVTMFLMAVFSIKDDSCTFDELAHIPAGYSYLLQKDYRLNPEHPPLIKDLAAIPLVFLKPNFPAEHNTWVQKDAPAWWTQFDFGTQFLYHSENNPDKILFLARLPMILILILLGFFIFFWTKKIAGNKAGLLALFLFSFSPTLLAHGRLVTTDVGAAVGILFATYFFLKALSKPTIKNIILGGMFFGLAMLIKFSTILLIPFFVFLALVWWLIKSGKFLKTSKILISVFLIGFALTGIVYQSHIWNHSPERQKRDANVFLQDYQNPIKNSIKNSIIWASDKPIIRPFALYFTGLTMALNRTSEGHTTYFLGQISHEGQKNYFPVVYAIKEPLGFHILTLIVLLYIACPHTITSAGAFGAQMRSMRSFGVGACLIRKPFWKNTFASARNWTKTHFPEFAMLAFIALYWFVSVKSNLNLGIRHLLPVFPFTFILVSIGIIKWIDGIHSRAVKKIATSIVALLLGWFIISSLSCFPYYLAYFNELAEGSDNGYIYTVDSNLDWGQDLKRLTKWMEKNNIDKIYVDYFGGGNPEYLLKEKYAPWQSKRDPKEFPKDNYLAVSVTHLVGGKAQSDTGLNQVTDYYMWLDQHELVKKIGYSIFVYYID